MLEHIGEKPNNPREIHDTLNYASALDAIKVNHDVSKMVELSSKGDADASYLLSRLYFKSKSSTIGDFAFDFASEEYQADSITELKKKLKIRSDNVLAHKYLLKAVDQNPKHYQALFELACDYWRADDRTDVVKKRDGDKAEQLFNQAKTYAQNAGDEGYVNMIDAYISRVMLWRSKIQYR